MELLLFLEAVDGNQHLGTVGNHALEDAGEGIQQAGSSLRGDAVLFAHFLGDGVGHND